MKERVKDYLQCRRLFLNQKNGDGKDFKSRKSRWRWTTSTEGSFLLIMKKAGAGVVGAGFILFIWTALSFWFKKEIVPRPWDIPLHTLELIKTTPLLMNLVITLFRGITGFVLALFFGSVIGILSGRYSFFGHFFSFPVSFFQGAPPLLWIIPLLLILGTTGIAPVFVSLFIVLPLVIITIQKGMEGIPANRWLLFRMYAPSPWLKLTRLILPSLAESYKAIFILGILLGLKSTLVGEWFGARDGIGRVINTHFYTFSMVSFYSIAFLFLLTLALVTYVTKRLVTFLFSPKKTMGIVYTKDTPVPPPFPRSRGHGKDVLRLTNVHFSYTPDKPLLKGVSIECTPGTLHVLTGNSGCGKTTFAFLAAGVLIPQKGEIIRPGGPGMVFQEDIFLPYYDCLGNVLLPLVYHKRNSHSNGNKGRVRLSPVHSDTIVREPSITARAMDYLKICGLGDYGDYFPHQLSGGMKKRLALARALALDPGFIILDEPFAQLDKIARTRLWELFKDLFSSLGIVSFVITHFPEDLVGPGVRLYSMQDGTIQRAT